MMSMVEQARQPKVEVLPTAATRTIKVSVTPRWKGYQIPGNLGDFEGAREYLNAGLRAIREAEDLVTHWKSKGWKTGEMKIQRPRDASSSPTWHITVTMKKEVE